MIWISHLPNSSRLPQQQPVAKQSHTHTHKNVVGHYVQQHFRASSPPSSSELSQVFAIFGQKEAWSKHQKTRKPLSAFLSTLPPHLGLTEERVLLLVNLNRIKLDQKTLMEHLLLKAKTKGSLSLISDQTLIQWTDELLNKKRRQDQLQATLPSSPAPLHRDREEEDSFHKHLEFRFMYLDPFRNTWDDPRLLIPKKKLDDSLEKELDRINNPVYKAFHTCSTWVDRLCESKKTFEDRIPVEKPLSEKEATQQTISNTVSLINSLLSLPLDPKILERLQAMASKLNTPLSFTAALRLMDQAMGLCVTQALVCHL